MVRKNTTWQTKPHQKFMEHNYKMCLTICIVTKPHLGKVCIFLPILFVGKLIHYLHSYFIVLLQHISPWTQSWIQAFIVAYENLTFKSVKQNCCFRNQCWDAVKSSQALKKVESNRPIRMQYFWPEYIKFQSELVQSSTFSDCNHGIFTNQ